MPFRKGQSGNPKGRPTGSKNKFSNEIKIKLSQVISENLEELPSLMAQLSPMEKISFTLKLLPFVISKAPPINEELNIDDFIQHDLSHVPTEKLKTLIELENKIKEINIEYGIE